MDNKSVYDVLIELGYQPKRSGDEYKMPALYRQGDSQNALSVNVSSGLWRDFVTGDRGNLKKLIKFHNSDIEVNISPPEKKIIRPTIFKKESLELLFPQDKFYNERGISSETLRLFKAGMAHEGFMYGRYTFPIIGLDGKVYGFSGRTVCNQKIKWKHKGRKAFWCYPAFLTESYILEKKEVILIESIGDCLSLWESGVRNTLIIFGLNISSQIISYLMGLDLKKIWISTNQDENNRGQEAAEKIQNKLLKFFDGSKVETRFPPEGFNDWGEVPVSKISEFWS